MPGISVASAWTFTTLVDASTKNAYGAFCDLILKSPVDCCCLLNSASPLVPPITASLLAMVVPPTTIDSSAVGYNHDPASVHGELPPPPVEAIVT